MWVNLWVKCGSAAAAALTIGVLSKECGAGGRTRTDDLLITNQLLYQLSYAGRLAGDERYSLARRHVGRPGTAPAQPT